MPIWTTLEACGLIKAHLGRKHISGDIAAVRLSCRWLPTVERELLAAQVEVATKPTDDIASARAQLLELRTGLIETAREHGLLVLASGTQPLARWALKQQTKKERYDRLLQQMQMLG